jgi:hypothetical protein
MNRPSKIKLIYAITIVALIFVIATLAASSDSTAVRVANIAIVSFVCFEVVGLFMSSGKSYTFSLR